ncbi:MAG: hypothetical protein U0J08_06390, partial [Agathobaculum butyriciproducens]|nr:hypothetical protein [Agathobaculum butyriciproducens]
DPKLTPDPDPDPKPPVDIPDQPTPLDPLKPTEDIPDSKVPTTKPETQTKTPDKTKAVNIPDSKTPTSSVPKTGDIGGLWAGSVRSVRNGTGVLRYPQKARLKAKTDSKHPLYRMI